MTQTKMANDGDCGVGSPNIRLREISIIRLDSGLSRTFSCMLLKLLILFRWVNKPHLHYPGMRKPIYNDVHAHSSLTFAKYDQAGVSLINYFYRKKLI